jgi:hypothetical protein
MSDAANMMLRVKSACCVLRMPFDRRLAHLTLADRLRSPAGQPSAEPSSMNHR